MAKIHLDTTVVEMGWREQVQNGITTRVWVVPQEAIGWHKDSKLPGQGGNIVLSGYNNQYAELFRDLGTLEPGDTITLYTGDTPHYYAVVQKLLLKHKGEPESVRRENARWIGPISEERVTLVSDWPYTSNTHKVVVVAWPIDSPFEADTIHPTQSGSGPTNSVLPESDDGANKPPSLADAPLVAEVESPSAGPEQPSPVAIDPNLSAITRIVIPDIALNAQVIAVGWRQIIKDGVAKNVWDVADFAAGWHKNSKLPGYGGNIVLSGHHNINGEVFRYLVDLEEGDMIALYQGTTPVYYAITEKLIVKEVGEPSEVKRQNAQWIGPMDEERLTLISCWPYNTNTHRLIVVAKPVPAPARPFSITVDPLSVERRSSGITLDSVPVPLPTPITELLGAGVFPASAQPNAALAIPTRIVAEKINLDAPVIEEGWKLVERNGQPAKVWEIPENAVGWHKDSKLPGQGGNVVMSGFHNMKGEVFRYLGDLNEGDKITLYTGNQSIDYNVEEKLILRDKGEPETVRRQNARWIGQLNEERLTLVTGWPYTDNTHRVIIVARPEQTNP